MSAPDAIRVVRPSLLPGSSVVCPRHGVGTVIDRRPGRSSGGNAGGQVTIFVERGELTLRMPVDSEPARRLRPVSRPSTLQQALSLLSGPPETDAGGNWHARVKRYAERLGGGDVLETAKLVRNLAAQNRASKLASTEHRMLLEARELLEAELSRGLELSGEEAVAAVDDQLARFDPSTSPDPRRSNATDGAGHTPRANRRSTDMSRTLLEASTRQVEPRAVRDTADGRSAGWRRELGDSWTELAQLSARSSRSNRNGAALIRARTPAYGPHCRAGRTPRC